ncbi:hypothetical protein T492DRAFT_591875 [Pavlovales sp. CCMP2436]|nr:hypothetical protein T492DRAFT_591875 [Pavlovales sp. CCMP2436]
MQNTVIAIAASLTSLAVALGIAYAAGYPGVGNQLAGSAAVGPVIAYAAGFAVVIQWIVFVPAYIYQTETYYDLTGSITYVIITLGTLIYRMAYSNRLEQTSNIRPIVSSVLVVIWAARLGSFLVRRIHRAGGKDGRFDKIKPSFAAFLAAWTIQGLWVFLTLLSVLILNTTVEDKELQWSDYLGWCVWLVGFSLEVISDNQKSQFNELRTGKWVEVGLWKYSRHPNYFGEIIIWVGQWIVGTSIYTGGQWVSVLSPLFVTLLLTKITGIPMLEKRADEKWGTDPDYQRYKKVCVCGGGSIKIVTMIIIILVEHKEKEEGLHPPH